MSFFLLVVGMTAVTYLPRLLPIAVLKGIKLPERLALFLSFIPYAAIGALLIPGGLDAIEGNPVASVIGLAAALLSAWLLRSFILTILIAILSVYLYFLVLP
jgi:branched-subunit amino acid transport protein